MNKKGLSILLALSMVFSLNSMAFAEEAVTEEAVVDAVVETEAAEDDVNVTVSQDEGEWGRSVNSFRDQTSFKDGTSVPVSGTNLELVTAIADNDDYNPYEDGYNDGYDDGYQDGYEDGSTRRGEELDRLSVQAIGASTPGVVYYNGSKIAASDLALYVRDKDTGYAVAVKAIKTSAKKDTIGQVTFTLKSIGAAKDVFSTRTRSVTQKEAKDAIKSLKSSFKGAKSQTFTAYIAPSFIGDSISADALKTLKKASNTLSAGAINELLHDWGVGTSQSNAVVYIKTKNGTVKKVQLVYLAYNYAKSKTNPEGAVYRLKVKTKTLKKDKDYKVNGDSINFEGIDRFAGTSIKAK